MLPTRRMRSGSLPITPAARCISSPLRRPYRGSIYGRDVNGVFEIGVYLDGAGTKINQTSICINGTDNNGNCESGSSSSAGAGIYALNTPDLSVNQTNIDGYVAGFATNPCPNHANELSVNHSTVTNSTYPWSFQGGNIK